MGKEIQLAAEEKNTEEKIDRTTTMRYCLHCNDDAVYPVDWEEDGPDHWEVLLRCGNCDTYRWGTFHQLEVEDFDAWLDDTLDEIQTAWTLAQNRQRKESHEEAKVWAEKFIVALNNDAIWPEDFR